MQQHKAQRSMRPMPLLAALIAVLLAQLPAAAQAASVHDLACRSAMQCPLVRMGTPQTQGEWLLAYLAAAHEHCSNLLAEQGAAVCELSVRCEYVGPRGLLPAPNSSSGARTSSFLLSRDGDAQQPHNATRHNANAAFWRRVGPSVQQPACLPNPFALAGFSSHACRQQQRAAARSSSSTNSAAVDSMLTACGSSPQSCLVPDINNASAVAAWWRGDVARALLDSAGGSRGSWPSGSRLHDIAQRCEDEWARNGTVTRAVCATRAAGAAPAALPPRRGAASATNRSSAGVIHGSSITLSRLMVAVMDAYESSGCEDKLMTASEEMAVRLIIADIDCHAAASCEHAHATSSGSSSSGSARRGMLLAALLVCVAGLFLQL